MKKVSVLPPIAKEMEDFSIRLKNIYTTLKVPKDTNNDTNLCRIFM